MKDNTLATKESAKKKAFETTKATKKGLGLHYKHSR
jgi:hypothetical protein